MIDFPEVRLFDASEREDDAALELLRLVKGLGIEAPMVIATIHGRALGARLGGSHELLADAATANQVRAAELGARARRSGADGIVAIGGGRCLDVAKLAAARAGVTVIAVPTQLSHDGICSPVAVVPDAGGVGQSIGAVAPRVVYLALPTLLGAPFESVGAGLGDLLANPLALRDWALAAEHGLEQPDQRAWDFSVESFERVKAHLDSDVRQMARDPLFLRSLADALVMSGMAMICAGSSRPASGGEHEISHAIDQHLGGRALHGAQVAFGCVFSVALYGEDATAFRERLARLGLPQHPGELGLSEDDVVELLLAAPDTRPGRFTILEDADLDDAKARALVRSVWGREQ